MKNKIKDMPEGSDKDALLKRAVAVKLDETASLEDIVAREKDEPVRHNLGLKIKDMPTGAQNQREVKIALSQRATAVGLDEEATKDEVEKAEAKGGKPHYVKGLKDRAIACGLDEHSSEAQVLEAEKDPVNYRPKPPVERPRREINREAAVA